MIYCIGDSFTYGDELTDAGWDNQHPSPNAWPGKLGQLTNRPVTNLGRRACGNTRLVKRIVDTAFKDDAELVVISWTSPNRVEFLNGTPYDVWPGRNLKAVDNKHKETLIKALTLDHNEHFDLWCMRKWIRDIIVTQNLLANQGKPYLMLVTWHDWAPTEDTQDLWDKVDFRYFIGHPTSNLNGYNGYKTMCYYFSSDQKLPGGHPTEAGHQQIAENINEYIRHFSWLS
jgi:lysophospholipase L1-like esterase